MELIKLLNLDGLTVGSIIAGVIATLLVYACSAIVCLFNHSGVFARQIFYVTNSYFQRTSLIFALSVAGAYALNYISGRYLGSPVSVPLTAAISLAVWALVFLWQFAHVDLHAAQLSVERGTDYESSLRLCKDNFWFLGTGANKLTSAPSFEKTILQCKPEATIRFLLSRSDNKIISDAAVRAGKPPEEYQQNVKNSLKRLAILCRDRGAKIEVRFYKGAESKDFEMFRMMFYRRQHSSAFLQRLRKGRWKATSTIGHT